MTLIGGIGEPESLDLVDVLPSADVLPVVHEPEIPAWGVRRSSVTVTAICPLDEGSVFRGRRFSQQSAESADVSCQQFHPVLVAVIPPRMSGDAAGLTPNTHDTSAVARPRPLLIALSTASRRARKGEGSAESAESADAVVIAV